MELPACHTHAYGPGPDQVGDLYLAAGDVPHPVVCLIHGGFWRLPWARDHLAPLASSLSQSGFAVWNVEYRRLGQSGGGWPGTFEDVVSAIAHLAVLGAVRPRLDLQRVMLVGHSAGGQLALWASVQERPAGLRVVAAVGLAPVADLIGAYEDGCGTGAVRHFLNGTPHDRAGRYAYASPAALIPLGVPQLIIHGVPDTDVPVELSRRYVARARAAGDRIDWVELPEAGHMDLIDPSGSAYPYLRAWLVAAMATTR